MFVVKATGGLCSKTTIDGIGSDTPVTGGPVTIPLVGRGQRCQSEERRHHDPGRVEPCACVRGRCQAATGRRWPVRAEDDQGDPNLPAETLRLERRRRTG